MPRSSRRGIPETSTEYLLTVKNQSLYLLPLALASLLASAPEPAAAADYYVDNAVSTSGNGSVDSPLRTIQEGLNRLAPGDVLWLRGDAAGRVYNETPSLPVSGTALQPITVRAFPNENVILTGTTGTRVNITKDHWIFDGLIIDQAHLAADAIKINASDIVIRNSDIRNGQREGISIEKASFVVIEDSRIHDFMWISSTGTRNDAHCIMIDTSLSPSITNITIRRNLIERCSGDGTQIFGVTGQAIATYAKNVQFLDNIFIEGTTAAGQTENALDFKAADTVLVKGNRMTGYKNNKTIVIQKGSRNITVDSNVIGHGLSGIEMRQEGGAAFLQENNRIIRNVIHHMSSFALKFDGLINATIANNTLANIGAETFRFDSTLGASTPSINGGLIKNNLSYAASSAPSGTSLLSAVDVGNNGWFQAAAGGLSRASSDTTGFDPLFTSQSGGDYRLAAGSAAIDKGIGVGLPFIGPAPDLGALEFSPTGDATPPAPPVHLRVQ